MLLSHKQVFSLRMQLLIAAFAGALSQHLFNILLMADSTTFPFPHSFPRGIDVTERPLSKCVCYFLQQCFVRP